MVNVRTVVSEMRSALYLLALFALSRPGACQLGGFIDNIGNSISNALGGGSGSAASPAQSADAALGGTFVQLRNVNPYIAGGFRGPFSQAKGLSLLLLLKFVSLASQPVHAAAQGNYSQARSACACQQQLQS